MLRELNLYGNEMSGTLPIGLFDLQGLKILSLGRNSFKGSIPTEIGKLHNHTREFHTMYKCNQCYREFATRNNFKEHNKLHLRPGYQCTVCDIKLKSKQSATHHFSNVHKSH